MSTPTLDDIFWQPEQVSPDLQENKEEPQLPPITSKKASKAIRKLEQQAKTDILTKFGEAVKRKRGRESQLGRSPKINALEIVDAVERMYALKAPDKLIYNTAKPKGRRLEKILINGQPWESRSMSSFLLEKSGHREYSYLALNVLRIALSNDRVGQEMQSLVGLSDADLKSHKLNPEIFCSEKVSMEEAEGGGVYVLFSNDGHVYIGYTVCFSKRRKEHTEFSVNGKFRNLVALGENKAKWRSHAIFSTNETYFSSYSLESIHNLLLGATEGDNLNCLLFDCAIFACIATDEDLERVWLSVRDYLAQDDSRQVHYWASTNSEAKAFWSAIDCRPLSTTSIYEFLAGIKRRSCAERLQALYPLPLNAFAHTPLAYLKGQEKEEHQQYQTLKRVCQPARVIPKNDGMTDWERKKARDKKRDAEEADLEERKAKHQATSTTDMMAAIYGAAKAKKKATQGR
ncbi:hypothetical protein JCM3765_002016 [Sporobolomyces pararoseus]